MQIFRIRTSAYSEEDFYLLTDLSEARNKICNTPYGHKRKRI